jgi:hypothetical protein
MNFKSINLKSKDMKKVTISLITVCLLLTFSPYASRATAAIAPMSTSTGIPAEPTPASQALIDRLAEIQSLDKSKMSGREKRELRKETRSIKRELKAISGGGVYLSVGALILILILLIVLL